MAGTLFDDVGPPPVRALSLVRLSSELARTLATIGRIAVEGEVTKPYLKGGRTWFELRDRAALVRVHCPASAARRCRVVDGERVRVTGRVEWRAQTGTLQLLADEVVPTGDGAMAALIEATRRALAADGLLDRPRRLLPALPRSIGVVCGVDAAVLADIRSVVAARWPGYPLVLATTTVSGGGAASSIEEALGRLDEHPEVDVIVLARGGGSPSDLLPWSDEQLCRAVAAAATPVVSAIGHEEDRPVVDDVADARFGTPSLAAGAVVRSRAELGARLDAGRAAARGALDQRLAVGGRRLERIDVQRSLGDGALLASMRLERSGARLAAAHPAHALARATARFGGFDARTPFVHRLHRALDRVDAAGRTLDALSPQRTLERGYAVVRRADGSVVRALDVPAGERLDVEVAAGHLAVVVDDVAGSDA